MNKFQLFPDTEYNGVHKWR